MIIEQNLETLMTAGKDKWTLQRYLYAALMSAYHSRIPEKVKRTPSMLGQGDRALYFYLAENFKFHGAMIDAGCFVGGTTIALAEGLKSNPLFPNNSNFKIQVFDLFSADNYALRTVKNFYPSQWHDGDDNFRPIFDQNTLYIKDLLDVYEGDLVSVGYPAKRPVELLSLDVCKSAACMHSVLHDFFPYLIPGKSYVIHQDYVHEYELWIHISMELLSEYFEPILEMDPFYYDQAGRGNSRVYRCVKEVTPADIKRVFGEKDDLSFAWYTDYERNKTLLVKAQEDMLSYNNKALLGAVRAMYAYSVGGGGMPKKEAVEIMKEVRRVYPDRPVAVGVAQRIGDIGGGVHFEDIETPGLNSMPERLGKFCEMSPDQREFLSGVICGTKARKIVEIGVSAGGSAAVILNAIRDDAEARLYSIDYAKTYYKDQEKGVGFIVHERFPELAAPWTLYTGKKAASVLDEIGGGIDVCLLDTLHSLPGEFIEYLSVLPYMKKNGIIVLHDISLNEYTPIVKYSQSVACKLLFGAIPGRHIVPKRNTGGAPPNIGAVILADEAQGEVWPVFHMLAIPWSRIQFKNDEWFELNRFFARHYGEKMAAAFDRALAYNRTYHAEKAVASQKAKPGKPRPAKAAPAPYSRGEGYFVSLLRLHEYFWVKLASSPRKFEKYIRSRRAFWEDSRNPLARCYARLVKALSGKEASYE